MPSTRTCNKCKRGAATEGDTWCLACSSLDLCQEQFKGTWHSVAVRAIAEEAALSAARYIRALSNLDRGLAANESVRARAPPPPPPRARSPQHRSRSRERSRKSSAAARPASAPKEEPTEGEALPTGESYEYTESEEEEIEGKATGSASAGGETSRDHYRAPPEPEVAPRSSGATDDRKKKPTRRGGKKHQRHSKRALQDPFKRTHRPLKGSQVQLAPNFRAGLERRA